MNEHMNELTDIIYARKQIALDRGRTDRISLTHEPMSLTLTYNFDFQSSVSYGRDLFARKYSRSTVSRF